MAAVDNGLLGIFASLQHEADVFGVRVASGAFIAALVKIADEFERVAWPAGSVFAHAPKQGTDLGVFEGGVRFVEKGVHGLGDGRVAVRRTIPVVDDAVIRGAGHRSAPLRIGAKVRRLSEAGNGGQYGEKVDALHGVGRLRTERSPRAGRSAQGSVEAHRGTAAGSA